MDLAHLDTVKGANDGADMHLRHPGSGQPLFDNGQAVTIRLSGEDGDRWRRAVRDAADARRRNGQAGPMTPEALEEEAIEVLAAISLGWNGITNGDGHPREFSHEAIREEYRRHPWLREQASAFKSERANFLAG